MADAWTITEPSLKFIQETSQLCRERIDKKTAPTLENRYIERAHHMVSLAEIKEAQARLRGIAVRTELLQSDLSQDGSANRKLYLKPENLQPIGSFKLRGAYNKIASLSDEERRRGVISYSSGNHAQGVAYAARALGVKAVIVMPNNAPAIKR